MAHELGMTVDDYLRGHTERQHRVWLAWWETRALRPGRTEAYLMSLQHEVRYLMAKKRPRFQSKDYLLELDGAARRAPAVPGTPEHAAEAAKAHAVAVAQARSVARVSASKTIRTTATAEQIRAMTPAERIARGNRLKGGRA